MLLHAGAMTVVRSGSAAARFERFLAYLDGLSAGVEPSFLPVGSTHPGLPQVTVLSYRDVPEPGLLTAVTYGLSLAEHSEWRCSKPELCICVQSSDESWAWAVGHIAEQLRGSCPFSYGDTVNFGERISPESEMTAFVMFAPHVLDPQDYRAVDVGDRLPVSITGCYPIHDSERNFVHERGLKEFWHLGWDPCDVRRAPSHDAGKSAGT